ncbi:hypothetical protein COR50_08475 [Chitinophaga caeni]|uniref:Uncharacterized protein n=1 Tax=Chitinophaga caeni TaxID=2029983 RepID=A0A291QTM0_9BACT|nr:hypothetical protein [Chitinophaga caeni]ATL47213.1 hypothetical protein COR50_08475 [Chitinophaga caeni]
MNKLLLCIITCAILNISCKKESQGDSLNSDEYYVKYEVNSSTIYTGGKLSVILNAENNQAFTFTINTRSAWETIIGPVKRGFKASLNVNEIGNNYGHLKLFTQISVSKNDSPFALKKINSSDTPRISTQIDYTIDY